MEDDEMQQLRDMARRWTHAARRTELENGEGDRYARGLDICAEQLLGELDRFARARDL